MTQIFVFTAGNPEAQRHLVDSIENPIDEETVFGSFASAHREELERIREEGNGYYAWGAVPGKGNLRNWAAMERDDYVLCVYGNAYHYASRVLAKYDNWRFAQRVWDTNHEGKTWQYMYFLTKPVEVYGRVPALGEYLNQAYLGFTRISNEKVDEILNDFGSVDNFIHEMLGGPESGVSTAHGLDGISERDIEELEDAEDLDKTEVDRELATIRDRLAQDPKLREGLDRQTTRTRSRPRSAAFEISVKKLYGFRCAICGSGLRTPSGKSEVQSAHIYPKRLDGSDDVRNGICLCRRHHWAMDAGWISIADDYTILVREDLPEHDNYQFIGEYEGERIRLPSVAESAPDPLYLREHRNLMGFE
jgi:putative restriction endonuclease